jgi:drug/metabolite transporter (DMT)-like permease
MTARHPHSAAASAKLMVVIMGFAWGINWLAARVILTVVEPWTMRAIGIGLGALTLFTVAYWRGGRLTIARDDWLKVVIAGTFNVVLFSVGSAFAQVYGTTSRAVVIAYTMPIWSALLARIVLKEQFSRVNLIAVVLCATGLAILIWPLWREGFPLGALLALGCAWSWAAGTIYQKRARIAAPTLAVAAWQLLFGWLMLAAGMLAFEGLPHLSQLPVNIVGWIGYNGLIGMGLAYFLWFSVIDRLPAITASLGSLLVPVVGVTASMLVLGERPTIPDIIGFAAIFAAAACVLLQPSVKHTEMPE